MNFTKITQGLRKMSICGKMVVMGARIRPVFAFKNLNATIFNQIVTIS